MVGGLFTTTQECVGLAAVRGTRPVPVVATTKSLLLLSVSWQPLDLRTPPLVELSALPLFTVVPPSPLFDAPHATESTMRASGSVHGVAVAPQPSAVPLLTRATLPLEADMLKPPEVKSALKFAPRVPAPPSFTVTFS